MILLNHLMLPRNQTLSRYFDVNAVNVDILHLVNISRPVIFIVV